MEEKQLDLNEWVTVKEAAAILGRNRKTGGKDPVDGSVVRRLAIEGKIKKWEISPRIHFYNRSDCEGYVIALGRPSSGKVRNRSTGRPPGRPRKKRGKEEATGNAAA